jgi:HK97 gp10 family phage protein
MAVISVKVVGTQLTINGLNKYKVKMAGQLNKAIAASGLVVQNEARRLVLQGPKTGRVYTRRGTIKHQASAPGEPPASDTGTLVRSIITSHDTKKFTLYVRAKVKYAMFLEQGTKRMKARPFLSVALKNMVPLIQKIFTKMLADK